jgi:hypothetical protein
MDAPNHPGNDSMPADAGMTRSPLCGAVGCFPGNPSACGATPEGDGSPWFSRAYLQAAEDAASDDAPDRSSVGPVDSSDDVSHADGAADATVADSAAPPGDAGAGDEPKVQRSCYVKPSTATPGSNVVAECAPVGQAGEGDPCDDSSNCGALLACVGVGAGKGTCRRFSCAIPTQCPDGSFYQLEALRVSGMTLFDVQVPVCLPTDHCNLLATPSSCAKGRVCAVVGGDGDTTCVVPGSAKLGDSCDDLHLCAEGLVCSKQKNQCLKICRVAAGATECPGGTCQGGNRSLPDGFGICVGTSPDSG